jgi:membrane fusion protein (multidrug efflux system)
MRQVGSGAMLGDDVVIHTGLSAGDLVAASGSFKLRDGVLVAITGEPESESSLSRTISKF